MSPARVYTHPFIFFPIVVEYLIMSYNECIPVIEVIITNVMGSNLMSTITCDRSLNRKFSPMIKETKTSVVRTLLCITLCEMALYWISPSDGNNMN